MRYKSFLVFTSYVLFGCEDDNDGDKGTPKSELPQDLDDLAQKIGSKNKKNAKQERI